MIMEVKRIWGLLSPKVSWHLSYRRGKKSRKKSPRKLVPTGVPTRTPLVESTNATSRPSCKLKYYLLLKKVLTLKKGLGGIASRSLLPLASRNIWRYRMSQQRPAKRSFSKYIIWASIGISKTSLATYIYNKMKYFQETVYSNSCFIFY